MPNPAPDPTDSWKVKRKRPSRNGLSRERPQCQQRDGPTEDRKKALISATVMFVGDFWPWNPRIRSMWGPLQVDSLTIGSVAAFFADELCWHTQTHKIFRSPRKRFSRRFILFRFRHSLGLLEKVCHTNKQFEPAQYSWFLESPDQTSDDHNILREFNVLF